MNAIFQAADENILREATWSGTAPSTGSSLTTFETLEPSARVAYGSGTATVTATITPARGDVLVIPVTNADGLTVTNGAGLNVSVPVPEMTRSRIPKTIVCDLSALQSNPTTRTSSTWNFAFSSGSGNLTIGGAIALFAPRHELLDGDFQWGGRDSRQAFGVNQENSYGLRYLFPYETIRRSVAVSKLATQTDLDALKDWFTGSGGAYGVSLLWPDPDVNDAYLGTLQDQLEVTRLAPTADGPVFSVAFEFEELTKGRPV